MNSPNSNEHLDTAAFIPIPLHSLRSETTMGFDLYLRVAQGNRYILYRDADLIFGERHRETLLQSNVAFVYVSATDRTQYMKYLEAHLPAIIRDTEVSAADQAQIVYECSRQLAQEVLEQPWASETIGRARGMVNHTVDLLIRGPQYVASLINLMSMDFDTYTHMVNVCVYGLALGQRVGLDSTELQELGAGLLYHDIGKTTIEPAILQKAAPLTAEEERILREHPQRGVTLLEQNAEFAPSTLGIVGQHHERCDGRGYPEGLLAHEIHQFAKIAALADVFDILTTNRPQQVAQDSFAAARVMHEEMREHFNPELLRELVLMLQGSSREDADAA